MMLSCGQTLDDRYRIVREIGRGGFGRVYLAEELECHHGGAESATLPLDFGEAGVLRQVAIKTFTRPRLTGGLVSELRALCKLSHPNIVSVFNYRTQGPPFIAMEYVVGQDLHTWLVENGPFGVADALAVARQVGEALAHAHAVGVLHRDVKPGNVIVTETAHAKLVDFGLARNVERLSKSSSQIGTPGFVAPELLDPDRFRSPIGVAADVYGLGCLLAALLTGESPFVGETPVEVLRNQLDGKTRPLDSLPPALAAVVRRATAVDPAERYPSVPALLEQLRRLGYGLARQSPVPDLGRRFDVVDAQLLSLERFRHPHRGRGVKFELAVAGDDALRRGFFYESVSGDNGVGDLYQSLRGAWPSCEVSLYDAIEIHSSQKGSFVSGDAGTVPILEPHFLVSVTDVVRSRGTRARDCPARVFVDLRDARLTAEPILLGRLVHLMLDDLVERARHPGSFDEHFDAAWARVRVEAVAAGLSDGDVGRIKQRARGSFEWLARFVTERLQEAGNSAEVSRYSGRYGLEGRIDLAVLAPDRLDIIELKSGRRQVPEHEAQLRCYALMWDLFAASMGRAIKSRLIYSQVGLERQVNRLDHAVERRILRTRNDVVAAHFALARGQFDEAMPHYDQRPERCQDAPCRFRRQRCAAQCANIGLGDWADTRSATGPDGPWAGLPGDLVEAARAYYRHFVQLIEKGYVAQSRAQGEFTRQASLAQRLELGEALGDAELVEWDTGLKAVRFRLPEGASAHALTPGTDVVVHRGDTDADATLAGRVEDVSSRGFIIRSAGAAVCTDLPRAGWFVEPVRARIGLREAHRALYGVLTERHVRRLRAQLFGQTGVSSELDAGSVGEERPQPEASPPAPTQPLNAAQRRALATALATPAHGGMLIHGPPGTGKTTVINAIAAALVARGRRVLVAAGTNTAVDNILEGLLELDVDFIRLGWLSRSSPLRRKLGRDGVARHVVGELGKAEPSLDRIAQRLMEAPVVGGTAHRCIRSSGIEAIKRFCGDAGEGARPFDVAIVDEATQLVEPLTVGVLQLAERFVLVGDAHQLPPVVESDETRSAYATAQRSREAAAMGLSGLDQTLFERLCGRLPEVALNRQYRMNRRVQDLSNRLYYGGRLEADEICAERRLELDSAGLAALSDELRRRLDPERALVWETLAPAEEGRRNEREVSAVVETIAALIDCSPAARGVAERIGVISPFRAQCARIRQGLAQVLGDDVARCVEVDTVERFQGREKEVMLVSLVVNSWSDFVMDDRRLNVAFTRARSKLIVFGPAQIYFRYETAAEVGSGNAQAWVPGSDPKEG